MTHAQLSKQSHQLTLPTATTMTQEAQLSQTDRATRCHF